MSACVQSPVRWVLMAALLCLAAPAFAAEFYVDIGNALASDANIGSEQGPWRTLHKAISVLGPGDTVFVKNGVYYEINNLVRSGSSGLPITIRNYPGHKPIVDGTGKNDATFDWSGAPGGRVDWITIDGFEIRNYWNYGVAIHGDHNSVQNCNIHTDLGPGRGEPVFLGEGNYNRIVGNEIHDSDWNGINVQNANFTDIAYNLVYDTPFHGAINIISNTSDYFGMMEGNDIHHNVLVGNPGAIYLRYQFNNRIYNNLIYKTGPDNNVIRLSFGTENGESPTHYVGNTEIYNNTIVGGKWLVVNESADNVTVKNNIFKDPDGGVFVNMYPSTTGHVLDYNLYSGSGSFTIGGRTYTSFTSYHGSGREAHSISGDPHFRNQAIDDYLLLVDSIAINAGTDLAARGVTDDLRNVTRPRDGLFDIGAYEFGDEDLQVIPAPPTGLRIKP
jgi:hypothetical protein